MARARFIYQAYMASRRAGTKPAWVFGAPGWSAAGPEDEPEDPHSLHGASLDRTELIPEEIAPTRDEIERAKRALLAGE